MNSKPFSEVSEEESMVSVSESSCNSKGRFLEDYCRRRGVLSLKTISLSIWKIDSSLAISCRSISLAA